MSKQLAEIETLESCEREIAAGFAQSCAALSRIREGRLYRKAGFKTFEQYCLERLGMSRQRGEQLADTAQVLLTLPAKCQPMVASERVARALKTVLPEKRVNVLDRAAKSGRVTAKSIKAAAREIVPEIIEHPALEVAPKVVGCARCTELEAENERQRAEIEALEMLVAELNQGEIPASPIPSLDDLRQIAAGKVAPIREADLAKNARCRHCGNKFAGSKYATLCADCRDNGHQETQPADCRGCQETFAA